MTVLMGDVREELAMSVWNKAIAIANEHKANVKPFYIDVFQRQIKQILKMRLSLMPDDFSS
jgi:hypothetical protein